MEAEAELRELEGGGRARGLSHPLSPLRPIWVLVAALAVPHRGHRSEGAWVGGQVPCTRCAVQWAQAGAGHTTVARPGLPSRAGCPCPQGCGASKASGSEHRTEPAAHGQPAQRLNPSQASGHAPRGVGVSGTPFLPLPSCTLCTVCGSSSQTRGDGPWPALQPPPAPQGSRASRCTCFCKLRSWVCV